jgi:hypothetical protein
MPHTYARRGALPVPLSLDRAALDGSCWEGRCVASAMTERRDGEPARLSKPSTAPRSRTSNQPSRKGNESWMAAIYPARRVRIGPRRNPDLSFFDPWVPREAIERHFPLNHGTYRAVATPRGLKMPTIMSLEEPRPRGTAVGERADRRRVSEAENFFRCNICGGYLDARD